MYTDFFKFPIRKLNSYHHHNESGDIAEKLNNWRVEDSTAYATVPLNDLNLINHKIHTYLYRVPQCMFPRRNWDSPSTFPPSE
jgi:hypothetical protein